MKLEQIPAEKIGSSRIRMTKRRRNLFRSLTPQIMLQRDHFSACHEHSYPDCESNPPVARQGERGPLSAIVRDCTPFVQDWKRWDGGDYAWGDENVPFFAVNHLPIFVPRKLSWSLVRERRVGGLKPWRSGLLQSLFTPVSFEFIRSPTHHFPCRRSAIRSKKPRIGAKDGGLGSVQDCRAVYFKRS